MASFLARVPRHNDRADAIDPARHRDRAAADEHDDHGFTCFGDGVDQLFLASWQREPCAIAEFALLDPCDDNCDIAGACQRDRLAYPCLRLVRRSMSPNKPESRVPGALEVLETELVWSFGEVGVDEGGAERLLAPVVDQQAPVDPETVSVISFDADPPDATSRRAQGARPARRIPVERNAAAG